MSRPITRRRRRFTAVVLAAGLTGSLLGLSTLPAQAADVPHPLGTAVPDVPKKALTDRRDKLGSHDRTLLQKAESRKSGTVTVLLATAEGDTGTLRAEVTGLGGHVVRADDKLGYVRATVPTGKVTALAALKSVRAVDLSETFKIPDPSPVTGQDRKKAQAKDKSKDKGSPDSGLPAAPGRSTPADNPYLPVAETGATGFTATTAPGTAGASRSASWTPGSIRPIRHCAPPRPESRRSRTG